MHVESRNKLRWRRMLSNQTASVATNYTTRDGYSVDATGSVTFEAGGEIRLQDGFMARSGSVFRTTISTP